MLHVPVGANTFGTFLPGVTTRPAAAEGASVTPGTGGFGGWAQLGVDTTTDTYGILICINSNSANNASRRTVVNIGIDPAGGTSYTSFIPDLIAGGAPTYVTEGMGQWYYFPLFIPRGSAVAAQAYGTVTTAIRVMSWLMQNPSNPASIRKGSLVESIGASTFEGTNVTPGTTGAGNWTPMGTTVNRLWWWQVGLQGTASDQSYAANTTIHLDVGVGDGTVGGTDIILRDFPIRQGTAAESFSSMPITVGCEWSVPAGSSIYVRAQNSGNNETGGYNCIVYGLGG